MDAATVTAARWAAVVAAAAVEAARVVVVVVVVTLLAPCPGELGLSLRTSQARTK